MISTLGCLPCSKSNWTWLVSTIATNGLSSLSLYQQQIMPIELHALEASGQDALAIHGTPHRLWAQCVNGRMA